VSAASPEWIRQFGGSDSDVSWTVTADPLGNVFIGGHTANSLNGSNAGSFDLFVSKYNSAGNRLWIRQLGSAESEVTYSIAADGFGNVYLAGRTGGDLAGPSFGATDAFLVKYDMAGNLLWTRQIGTAAGDEGHGVSTDAVGNVYLSGRTAGDLGGTNAGLNDAFLSKYDSAGNQLWTRQLGSSASDVAADVAADVLGNVFISGTTRGDLAGPHAGGSTDVFLAKYDNAGNHQWSRQFGTPQDDATGVTRVAADNQGNALVVSGTNGGIGAPNIGGMDGYVTKFDVTGSQLWSRQLGTTAEDRALDVATDALGNVFAVGETRGIIVGAGAGNSDVFVAKYDAAGNLHWNQQFGSEADDTGFGVSGDGQGNLYLSGITDGDFGGTNAGPPDAFLAKLNDGASGDYNNDGAVGAADYVIWRNGLGGHYAQGDHNIWRANFGATTPGSGSETPAAVPEPGTILLAILAIILAFVGAPLNARARQVGPDSFGYVATNAYVQYESIDISTTGQNLNHHWGDSTLRTIGFNFAFYGTSYGSVYVNTNGNLRFSDGPNAAINSSFAVEPQPIEGTDLPVIAPYWDDWDAQQGTGNNIYVETIGQPGSRQFIVQYHNIFNYPEDNRRGTYQAILFEGTNDIVFQYPSVSDVGNGRGGTIGIRNYGAPANGRYVQWSYDQASITDGMAIRFTLQPILSGDFNNNGTVDSADYVVWRNGLGTVYNQADFNIWRANFGATAAGSGSAMTIVPEPPVFSTLGLALGHCASVVRRRRTTIGGTTR
jgi:hypothetical protein